MQRLRFFLRGLAATAGLLTIPVLAHADSITFTLTDPVQSVSSGSSSTTSFYATVSAPISNLGTENLNGDRFTVTLPEVLDDSGYFNTFPLFLNPGDSYTGLLFTVMLPASALPGEYGGTFLLTGGPTGNSDASLGTVSYDVAVSPEPSSLILLGTGCMSLFAAARRKR